MTYARNRKGITIVMIALMLFVLLAFLGLAVDISYMYFAKNQLQVAADAASLAGAALLTGDMDTSGSGNEQQPAARQAAWKFACKNRAADQAVFLVTTDGEDSKTPNCNKTVIADLNGANSSSGDIVVGHWSSICPTGFSCGTGLACEPEGSGYFCPATGGTGLIINALKARPRMTGEPNTPMPKTKVFVGQVFEFFLGINWSRMSARASAIAAKIRPHILPLLTCFPSCNLNAPLNGQWDYDKNDLSPILCTDASGSPPGQRFYINPSAQDEAPGFPIPGLAWTNFVIGACNSGCTQPTKNNVEPYILGAQAPDLCNQRVCTSNGDIVPLFQTLAAEFLKKRKTYTFDTGSGTQLDINGWDVWMPIVSNLSCTGSTVTQACPGDRAGDPYLIQYYVRVLITEVFDSAGKKGIRILAFNNTSSSQLNIDVTCDSGQRSVNRRINTMTCINCSDPGALTDGTKAKLVK